MCEGQEYEKPGLIGSVATQNMMVFEWEGVTTKTELARNAFLLCQGVFCETISVEGIVLAWRL